MAPMQGYTDAPWRHFFRRIYPGAESESITPFIRLEKGVARERDMRDFTSELNAGAEPEAQVIFRDGAELGALLDGLTLRGARRVSLNLGCPFPLQTGRGRGAAMIVRPGAVAGAVDVARRYGGVTFSVKMRLGMDTPGQWRAILPELERLEPAYIAMHPRTARQQYRGAPDMEAFGEFLAEAPAPVVYNGDLRSPGDIDAVMARWPSLTGVMAGRGLIGRPSLFEEHRAGREMPAAERIDRLRDFHSLLLDHRRATLCGEAQVMAKMKPFWEYSEGEIGRKALKAINKASTLARYEAAVEAALR